MSVNPKDGIDRTHLEACSDSCLVFHRHHQVQRIAVLKKGELGSRSRVGNVPIALETEDIVEQR